MSATFIHPTALVQSEAIGEGTRIWAFTNIMPDVRVGADCNVGDHCFLESGVVVGNGVTIKNGNNLWEGVTLEDGVFVGPSVVFTNDRYPRSPRLPEASQRYADKRRWLLHTRVRRGASLGAGTVLLAGTVIGEFATLAAGSVVTRDVSSHALMVGAPARRVGWVCSCGERLGFEGGVATCQYCGARYREEGEEAIGRLDRVGA